VSAAVLVAAALSCGAVVVWQSYRRESRAAIAAQFERESRAAIAAAQEELQHGQAARALMQTEMISEDGPWAAELLTTKGIALAALDRPDAVRTVLERSLEIDPNQPIAAKVLAAVYFTAEEPDRGFALLERAAQLDPTDFRPWFASGDILLRLQNRPDDAARAFREALLRRPDHDPSRLGLIGALIARGSVEEVSPMIEAALRDRSYDPKVLRLAALHARLLGRPEEMSRYNEQALAIDPDDPTSLVLRAQDRHRQGRYSEALADAERAVAQAPGDPAAVGLLAQIERSLGMGERAAATATRHRELTRRAEQFAALRQAIHDRPADPEPRWRLGRLAFEGGMTALAAYSFRVALELDPQCMPARDGLTALNLPASPLQLAGDKTRPARLP
jgi:tetratricopeptide (TPR) repeat protein